MAVVTYAIIRQGKRKRDDTERPHRDRLKPICVLVPHGGVDPWNRRDQLVDKIDPTPDNASLGTLAIRCALRNVGTGPALNLRISFRFLGYEGLDQRTLGTRSACCRRDPRRPWRSASRPHAPSRTLQPNGLRLGYQQTVGNPAGIRGCIRAALLRSPPQEAASDGGYAAGPGRRESRWSIMPRRSLGLRSGTGRSPEP